jgi:3',5'-nucleoside bisphosphate phosphatase
VHAFDIHCHTHEHSPCSRLPAAQLVERALELKLAGVVLTDHHYQWPQDELQALARDAGAGKLVLLSGYELTTSCPQTGRYGGDLLIYGMPQERLLPPGTPADEACALAHEQGALVISAHPFRQSMGAGDLVYALDIDGLEVMNDSYTGVEVTRAREVVRQMGFLGLAGSDAHQLSQVGQFLTTLQRPVTSMDEFTRELRARRFRLRSRRRDIH